MTDTPKPSPPTTPATPATPSKKKKKRRGPLRWVLGVFGPSLLIGGVVWFLLRDHTEHALFLGALAGAMFLVSWTALSHRLRRAGRHTADFFKSAFIALLTVGLLVAAIWYFFLR